MKAALTLDDDRPSTRPRKVNRPLAAWRKARAVELAVEGRTYEQIAREVGYANGGTAYRVVRRALEERTAAAVDELRDTEVARLDALQVAQWDKAMAGDVGAARAVLRIIEARCRLLGLWAEGQGSGRVIDPASTTVVVSSD